MSRWDTALIHCAIWRPPQPPLCHHHWAGRLEYGSWKLAHPWAELVNPAPSADSLWWNLVYPSPLTWQSAHSVFCLPQLGSLHYLPIQMNPPRQEQHSQELPVIKSVSNIHKSRCIPWLRCKWIQHFWLSIRSPSLHLDSCILSRSDITLIYKTCKCMLGHHFAR